MPFHKEWDTGVENGLNPGGRIRQAIVLAGGRGTRLGLLTQHTPKPLLPVAGKPFLAYLLWLLAQQGVSELVLSVGYLSESIIHALGDGSQFGVRIRYAVEETPLGTGGAVRFAASFLPFPDNAFFVLNGDTLLDCNLQKLARLTLESDAAAGMALRQVEDVGRYGAVITENARVTVFSEKSANGAGMVNGGVYALLPQALDALPEGASSIEQDLFPQLTTQGKLAGLRTSGFFLDIGLPETYQEAQTALPEWQSRAKKRRPFVLLDRDGTLIEEKNYLCNPDEVVLLPGAGEGLAALQRSGFGLAVVTNQAGIGRGYYQKEDMEAVNSRMAAYLSEYGVHLDGLFFCPHHPDEGCFCRKPRPGLVIQAMQLPGFFPDFSYVVGDKACDVDLALGVGASGILVKTGYGKQEEAAVAARADYVADDLLSAAQWIMRANAGYGCVRCDT